MGSVLGFASQEIAKRIISYGTSYDGGNCGLFVGAVDYDFNLNTPSNAYWLEGDYTSDLDLSSGDFSIEAYFNANSFTNQMAILAKDTYGQNFDWSILINSPTTIQFLTNATGTALTVTVPTMNTGQWYHVKFTHTAIGSVNTIHLDGVLYGTSSFSISNSSQVKFTIGCTSYNNPGNHFDGYLDEVRIIKNSVDSLYLKFQDINPDRVSFTDDTGKYLSIKPDATVLLDLIMCTDLEILGFTAPITNNCIMHFDPIKKKSYDRLGTTIIDLSGNLLNGELTNGPTFNTTDGSLNFDGIDDFILVEDGVGATTPAFGSTIEMWIYPTDLTTTSYQNLWRNEVTTSPSYIAQAIAFKNNGTTLTFGINGSATGYTELEYTINPVIFENTWMHIVATYNGNDTTRLYVNGVKVKEAIVANVGSPYGVVFNKDGWSDLSDYTTRTYDGWGETSGWNPPSMVGQEWIMYDYINSKYYKLKFTQWTSGNNGGGFAYTRQEILSPTTFGTLVTFTKPNFATSTVDAIDTGLTIKRNNNQGIYNVDYEAAYQYDGYYFGGGSAGTMTPGTENLSIGSSIVDPSNAFKGRIGTVRLYDTDFTESEVLNNYNATKGNY